MISECTKIKSNWRNWRGWIAKNFIPFNEHRTYFVASFEQMTTVNPLSYLIFASNNSQHWLKILTKHLVSHELLTRKTVKKEFAMFSLILNRQYSMVSEHLISTKHCKPIVENVFIETELCLFSQSLFWRSWLNIQVLSFIVFNHP